jgi:hypothetical protein
MLGELGLVLAVPADEAALVAREGERLQATFQGLQHRDAVQEDPGGVAAQRALPLLVDDLSAHPGTVERGARLLSPCPVTLGGELAVP